MIVKRRIEPWLLLAACLLTTTSAARCITAQSQQQAQSPTVTQAVPPSPSEVVWVNTASGYYHKPSSRHYGKTKHGKYMTQSDAIRAGYRSARN
jgi:hypothetical protein